MGASVQWKHPSSPSAKKLKVTPSGGKVMLTVFWESQGVLLKLRDAKSQKMPMPTGKRGTASSRQSPTPYSQSNQGENSKLRLELLEHPPYGPDLVHSDFHLFGLLINTLAANVSLLTKRFKGGDAEVTETTVKRLLCSGFQRTGKAMGQMYQCWWRICHEMFFFSRFKYHIF
jgi:hypothetical protein